MRKIDLDEAWLGFMLGFCVGMLFVLALSFYDNNKATCTERWKYQRTIQDTLNTVRSGCDLPDK